MFFASNAASGSASNAAGNSLPTDSTAGPEAQSGASGNGMSAEIKEILNEIKGLLEQVSSLLQGMSSGASAGAGGSTGGTDAMNDNDPVHVCTKAMEQTQDALDKVQAYASSDY